MVLGRTGDVSPCPVASVDLMWILDRDRGNVHWVYFWVLLFFASHILSKSGRNPHGLHSTNLMEEMFYHYSSNQGIGHMYKATRSCTTMGLFLLPVGSYFCLASNWGSETGRPLLVYSQPEKLLYSNILVRINYNVRDPVSKEKQKF